MRTLGQIAVLFLVSGLIVGCEIPQVVGPLSIPEAGKVSEVGRFDDLPVSVSARPDSHLNGPIIMDVKLMNVTDHAKLVAHYDFEAESYCVFWLIHEGREVPLSNYGRTVQQREIVSFWSGSLPPCVNLNPAESIVASVDLAKIFRISDPGRYTVIVEVQPFFFEDNVSRRELDAAKTTFEILPKIDSN